MAEGYDQRRFASVLGRRKHRNDVARLLDTLAHHLPSPGRGPGGLILDLPCGTGRLGAELMAAGYRVVGADLAPVMLSQAAASAASPMHLLCAEAEHLPLPAAAVDVVISLRFLIHIQDPAVRREILAEMARVTRHLVIGQIRDPHSLKHRGRSLRRALGCAAQLREPSPTHTQLEAELRDAGLELLSRVPISRVFSDKSLFVARPLSS